MAIDVSGVNDGAVIQDFNSRNAITGLKTAITTVGNRVCSAITSAVVTTDGTIIAAKFDSIINNLRQAGLMN